MPQYPGSTSPDDLDEADEGTSPAAADSAARAVGSAGKIKDEGSKYNPLAPPVTLDAGS